MPQVTIVYALACIALGLFAYFGASADKPSVTALIPAMAGGVFLVLGIIALRPAARKHAMHAAAALSLLLIWVPAIRGFPGVFALLTGGQVANPRAAVVQSTFAVLCIVFVLLCVRSFIAARVAQAAEREAGLSDV
ncbi:MAG: hypothetical protein D6744_09260 [Planctomycetota bacterium]|nr:MAG: hypothetical protein D6744_09260 [Planctomycetota bacterium]